MGTRADFYVGRGEKAEWLGSIGWDGYPDGIDKSLLKATTEQQYRNRVKRFFDDREDATYPKDGWPWPWDDSTTTDYAYAFDNGQVWASSFGTKWFKATEKQPESDRKVAKFPDMRLLKNITLGKRSGLVIITRKGA